MEAFLGVLALVVLAVPILLVVALVSIGGLRARVGELEDAVRQLRLRVDSASPAAEAMAPRPAAPVATPPAPLARGADGQEPTLAELLAAQAPTRTAPPASPPRSATTPPPLPPTPLSPAPPAPPVPERARVVPSDASPSASAAASAARSAAAPASPRLARVGEGRVGPSPFDAASRLVRGWFTTGNVPVKVGMLVLLAGVAALLKYVSDQGWLQLPIELRFAGIAAAALAAVVFGWRQRVARPAFALAVQGGAIGVLLLVVFAAFRTHGLLPATAAFAISVTLVAAMCVLAVLQDSRTLAAFGLLAGFLAPIWLSSGSGNHVALFSYYALFNVAIFAIAWRKSWRQLNLLGFVFTWGIGVAWGVLAYTPDKLATTQPFLVLFFALYLLLPILHARLRPIDRRDLVDGCLLFGTPLVAFSLQAALLDGERMPLAFCALGVAALYAALAWALRRRSGDGVLVQAHALLAMGFATLSVPLALSAHATAAVFAVEGAALVWLGLRQHRAFPQWCGLGLQLAAAVAYARGAAEIGEAAQPIAHPAFMGALLIAVAGFASAWACRQAGAARAAGLYYLWGLAWWCGNLVAEIHAFVPVETRLAAMLASVVVTGWGVAEVQRRRPARALALTACVAIALALPLALGLGAMHGHPLAGVAPWAWLLHAVLGVRSLRGLRIAEPQLAGLAQFAWWLAWPLVLSLSAAWAAHEAGLGEGWSLAALAMPWLLMAAVSLWAWDWLRLPVGPLFDPRRPALQLVLAGLLGLWWWATQLAPGDAAPLLWIPLFNPLELAQLGAVLLLALWLRSDTVPPVLQQMRVVLLSAAGFVLITAITLRGVHQLGGIPWDDALVGSQLAQTSLTVVWSLLGVIGWILGSRRGQRSLWLAGAVLMAVVLAKLGLVDRRHLGELFGIGSFIAYGLLCTLVGYLAPAPPRLRDADRGLAT